MHTVEFTSDKGQKIKKWLYLCFRKDKFSTPQIMTFETSENKIPPGPN